MNYKTVKKTYKSYCNAFKRLNDRGFTNLGRSGSGYTHYLGEEFTSYGNSDYSEADDVYIRIAKLLDFGKPIVVEPSYWIYRSSFFQMTFEAIEKYTTYSLDGRKIRTSDHSLKIVFADRDFGLGKWKENKKEIIKIVKMCKEQVRSKILEHIEDANKEVNDWITATKEQQANLNNFQL